jgi:hypothetical protein
LKLGRAKSSILPYQVEDKKEINLLACSCSVPFWGVRGARLCPAVSGRVWPIPFPLFDKEISSFQKKKKEEIPVSIIEKEKVRCLKENSQVN